MPYWQQGGFLSYKGAYGTAGGILEAATLINLVPRRIAASTQSGADDNVPPVEGVLGMRALIIAGGFPFEAVPFDDELLLQGTGIGASKVGSVPRPGIPISNSPSGKERCWNS